MCYAARRSWSEISTTLHDRVEVLSLTEIKRCPRWRHSLTDQRKDHRYYAIVEETIQQGFDYRYFAIQTRRKDVHAIIPFFVLDLDMLAGTRGPVKWATEHLRHVWPRFMWTRALMVGCAAGEGHLDDPDWISHAEQADQLSASIIGHAKHLGANLIVFKEFSATYRSGLGSLLRAGFTRIPSFPAACLNIDYRSFDEFMRRALSRKTRKDLRLKFRIAEAAPAIELIVTRDITTIVDEIYPLYLQVYQRAHFRFEKLTKEYLCRMGRQMPDKVRFFVWRQQGRIVAFSLCMVHGAELFGEYLGFDYEVALKIHLYHYVFRDVISWGIAHGYKVLRTNGANYDPKLHLRFRLDPLDLYVRHTSEFANIGLSKLLPILEPTHYDPILKRFPNYNELWSAR